MGTYQDFVNASAFGDVIPYQILICEQSDPYEEWRRVVDFTIIPILFMVQSVIHGTFQRQFSFTKPFRFIKHLLFSCKVLYQCIL